MKNINLRILALALALMTMLPLIFACADGDPGKDADTVTDAGTDAQSEVLYKADIPAGTRYDGETFTIYTFGETLIVWYDVDFAANEENGELLNDAAYKRMRNVEDMFGITIEDIPTGNFGDGSALRSSVAAQDEAYDIAFLNMRSAASLSQSGYLYDMHVIDTLNLENPWWDQNAVSDLSFANKLFMVTGDIEIMYKKSIGVILFNKQIIEDFPALESPYELVDNKTWTIDKMTEMSRGVSLDIDGNDVMDKADRYGFLYYSDISALGMLGAGVKFITKDSDDLPQLTFYSELAEDVFSKYTELFYDTELSYADNNEDVLKPMFIANQALFDFNEFHAIEQLRQMDADFGILPIPLYNEQQERYYHTINPHVGSVLCVPADNLDTDRIGYIIEALGAESKNILTPAYYDIYLKTKGARDDDSEAVIDIVLGSLTYDLGYMHNWGNLGSFMLEMVQAKKTSLSSSYEAIESAVERQMDKAIEDYLKLDD